ncbi:FHIPEP family type III secretion protein [bacterium]|nr:FHIPEP family type III secretion protein [bacterium]
MSRKMQYVIKTCSSENTQELQNLLNEMSMNGWELYSMQETEDDDGRMLCHCIFMKEAEGHYSNSDVINISTFRSQMEKMLSPHLSPYEICLDIQSKIREEKNKISKAKKELESEAIASVSRKKLNDKISSGLKELEDLKSKLAKATSPDSMFSNLKEEKLSIHLSEEILGYVDPDHEILEEELVAETVKSRLKITEELGYIIPKIVFQDDENLNPYEFTIRVRGFEVFKASVYPNFLMFFADDLHLDKKIKNSINDIDEITGKKIVWIEKNKTKDFWQNGITGAEFVARALEYCAVKYVDELLDYEEVEKYIDVVASNNDFLVENIIPEFVTLSDLRYILTCLIKERISIKDITYIFEKLNDFAEESSRGDIIKKIRLSMSKQICKNNKGENGVISAFEMSETTLDKFIPNIEEGEDSIIRIDADFAEKFADKLNKKIKKLNIENPKLLVPMEFRHLIFTLLCNYMNNITVLSREEIGYNAPIEVIAEI